MHNYYFIATNIYSNFMSTFHILGHPQSSQLEHSEDAANLEFSRLFYLFLLQWQAGQGTDRICNTGQGTNLLLGGVVAFQRCPGAEPCAENTVHLRW
jgi:hypothetical protein